MLSNGTPLERWELTGVCVRLNDFGVINRLKAIQGRSLPKQANFEPGSEANRYCLVTAVCDMLQISAMICLHRMYHHDDHIVTNYPPKSLPSTDHSSVLMLYSSLGHPDRLDDSKKCEPSPPKIAPVCHEKS